MYAFHGRGAAFVPILLPYCTILIVDLCKQMTILAISLLRILSLVKGGGMVVYVEAETLDVVRRRRER
jgi:hypothetical protein